MLCCCALVSSIQFVCSIEFEIWTVVCRKLKWRHNDVIILSIFYDLSDISNFNSIEHKRAEIQNREDSKEWWRTIGDLWSKVTNFNWVWTSAVSNNLAKIVSKSVHPLGWKFVRIQSRTHTDKLQWKYNPPHIKKPLEWYHRNWVCKHVGSWKGKC